MPLIDFRVDETVAVISMNSGDNRFNPDFIQSFLDTLDTVEMETTATALVVTSSHEKIFSNGLDLDWLLPVIQKKNEETFKSFFNQINILIRRLVTYPLLSVAAISGHAFAMGAIITGAFDFRFMRSDRGYFCLPEVDLGIPFFPAMLALLRKAVPRQKLEEIMLTGERLTAVDCEAHHIIKKACHRDDLLNEAITYAKGLNKRREVVAELKTRWNADILHAIDVADVPYIEGGTAKIKI